MTWNRFKPTSCHGRLKRLKRCFYLAYADGRKCFLRYTDIHHCNNVPGLFFCVWVFVNVFIRSIQGRLWVLPFNTHLSVPNQNAMEIVQRPSTTHTQTHTHSQRRAHTHSHKCTHTQKHTQVIQIQTLAQSLLWAAYSECLFLQSLLCGHKRKPVCASI